MLLKPHMIDMIITFFLNQKEILMISCILKPISPSDSARYAHTDLSSSTTELWETSVFSPADGAIILHMIK